MSHKKYMWKKILTDFIIINLVINAAFYVINFWDFKGQLTIHAISFDLVFGLVLLGIFCSLIGFVNIRKDLKKGKVDVISYRPSKMSNYFPKHVLLRVIILAILTVSLMFSLFAIIPSLLGVNDINHVIGFSIKTISAGIGALGIGYVVLDLSFKDYQKNEVGEAKQ
ncbi:hypothetical protein NT04LS_1265 [Listeria seeligeri FSL S4-171]|uniref:hypothetical protein n=1 Tax=Listeria seeligeri TaxID=1640 RepID=UPI0001EB7F8A|nr:hypothetical protein [Listeria seeligeri]EFS03581.1 hypothetical protein NT04LS_1265 [Listeria seeligeri FSL S4-171]MBF2665206.1 hypothetical protein [Listeria seeligeri]